MKLKKIPKRIECYDISNVAGSHAVGSMIVFTNGETDKSQYRKFSIKYVEKNKVYDRGKHIGYTTVTEYMKKSGYGEHLHFEVWRNDRNINPIIYFEQEGILYG